MARASVDGRRGEVDAGDVGAAFREPRQIDAGAAADFENRSAAIAVKVHEPEQVMELLEMVLVEIVEEPARADRMPGDLEIVNVAGSSTSRTSSIVATSSTLYQHANVTSPISRIRAADQQLTAQ